MTKPQEHTQPGEKRQVTQKDVAARAGVSRAVVSYVINNGPRVVSPEARARVLQAIEELDYRPNLDAQRLKRHPARRAVDRIGIIMGGTSQLLERPYFASVVAGIYAAAHRQSQQIGFLTFFNELLNPVIFNQYIHPEAVSGLILCAPYHAVQDARARALLARIRERVHNIISLEVVSGDFPAVIFDRAEAARLAVGHLAALGHRRIAYAGSVDERVDGYRQVLLAHGLPTDPAYIRHDGLFNLPEDGYSAAQGLMALPEPPTAIFAASDEVALGVIAGLHDLGLAVPGDVAVASVDNIGLAAMCRPALTTVHVPKESFGLYALRMLATHDDYADSQPASVVLPIQLVVRESSGAPRA